MDPFIKAVEEIVKEQQTIIGPLALEQAKRVKGLDLDLANHQVKFNGNKTDILQHLVEQYRTFFGQASVQVCKDAAKSALSQMPPQEVPALLK